MNVDLNILDDITTRSKQLLRDGLKSFDIFDTKTGLTLAAVDSNPMTAALFSQLLYEVSFAMENGGFPPLRDYMMLGLKDQSVAAIIRFSDELTGIAICDRKQTNVGMIAMMIQRAVDDFRKASASVPAH